MLKRLAVVAAVLILPLSTRAHCDTLDGPVVNTARAALETGKLAPVLAWVRAQDEAEIRAAFQKAAAARKHGPEARAVADTWFFETVVRVHRAGEGAPFTGLKPAGQDLGPAVPAADRALQTGDLAPLEKQLVEGLREGVRHRFARVRAQKPPAENVAAGRAWVAAYVPFVHYVEAVHDTVSGGARGGHAEGGAQAGHADAGAQAGHADHGHAGHAPAAGKDHHR